MRFIKDRETKENKTEKNKKRLLNYSERFFVAFVFVTFCMHMWMYVSVFVRVYVSLCIFTSILVDNVNIVYDFEKIFFEILLFETLNFNYKVQPEKNGIVEFVYFIKRSYIIFILYLRFNIHAECISSSKHLKFSNPRN